MRYEIKKLGINGEGIAYQDRKPVFIPGAYPTEIVEAKVVERNNRYSNAKLDKILRFSKERVRNGCPNRACETCPLVNMDYEAQLKYKEEILIETLEKYADVSNAIINPMVENDHPYGYRNALKLPFGERNGKLVLGTYAPGSNRLIEIKDCKVQDPELNRISEEILKALNKFHVSSFIKGKQEGVRYLVLRGFDSEYQATVVTTKSVMNDLLVNEMQAIRGLKSLYECINTEKQPRSLLNRNIKRLFGASNISCQMAEFTYHLSPSAFFQLNVYQAEKMYELAASYINPNETVLDAYCGIGAITLFLARNAKKVIGIENNHSAVNDATHNAKINKITNCEFIAEDAGSALRRIGRKVRFDTIVVDPPRSGLNEEMIDEIKLCRPKQVVYVSCNPATLAKNIDALSDRYAVEEITPFDLFSNTPLVETVCLLRRK